MNLPSSIENASILNIATGVKHILNEVVLMKIKHKMKF